MILAGDLYDANRPSRNTENRVISLLRHYCEGSGDILFTRIPTNESPLAEEYVVVNE